VINDRYSLNDLNGEQKESMRLAWMKTRIERSGAAERVGIGQTRFIGLAVCLAMVLLPIVSGAQDINRGGWPVPDLKGLSPYSVSVKRVDGVEKMMEKFLTPDGGHVARISGNGKVFAYVVDADQEPPIDCLLLDLDGYGKFTVKLGPEDSYKIPDWVSH
jgi:hypothetical protein